MLHAVELGKRFGLDHVASEGLSGNPAGAALLLSPTARTRNRVPIWSGPIKRANAASMARRSGLAGARSQGLCTLHDAQPLQKLALADRPEGRNAGGLGEGRKIDMRAQVGLAGPLENRRAAMAAHGLQRGAVSAVRVAVVDDQRPAAILAQARADRGGDGAACFGDFRLRTGRCIGQQRGIRRHPGRERKAQGLAVVFQPDHAFGPAARGLLELAHRQGVEEFVGDQQHRAGRHVLEAAVPRRVDSRRARSAAKPAVGR